MKQNCSPVSKEAKRGRGKDKGPTISFKSTSPNDLLTGPHLPEVPPPLKSITPGAFNTGAFEEQSRSKLQ
jgi:hypothetical protein